MVFLQATDRPAMFIEALCNAATRPSRGGLKPARFTVATSTLVVM